MRAGVPTQSWELAGNVTGFNPAALRPGFDGALNFHLQGQRRAVRQRQPRRHLRQSVRQAARQFRQRRRPRAQARRGLDLRRRAPARRHDQPVASTATSARRARSISPSASTPTISGCWPKARAARCTRAARSPDPRARRWSSSMRRARTSSTTTSSVDKLAANVDVDWRGQRASHADVAISGLTVDERALTQFNAVLDGTTGDHAVQDRRARRQDQPASVRQGRLRQRCLERDHRRSLHRRHRQHQPASSTRRCP